MTSNSLLADISADNGVETLEVLKSAKVDDINSFGLNFGEKIRVMDLLSSLRESSPGNSECFTIPHLVYQEYSHSRDLFHICFPFVQMS